jgi:acetaldehyde dehydrogenase/alcohol dehydrogenase
MFHHHAARHRMRDVSRSPRHSTTRSRAGDVEADNRESLDRLTRDAVAAQRALLAWAEDDIDALVDDVAERVAEHAEELARATVEETGIGNVADKAVKNRFASIEVAASMIGRPGVGALELDRASGILRIADPVGVVVGLTPVTNPVATTVFKALICLKSRNSLIVSGHRTAGSVTARTGELVREVLRRRGAPEDLVQVLRGPSDRTTTARLMAHPEVDLVLATGGPALVRAAYSSGTPAIGVGAGNAPVWIARDADLARAAALVVAGKAFDHGVICGSENNLVVDREVRADLLLAVAREGAYILDADECRRLQRHVFDRNGRLVSALVGRSAGALAHSAGIAVPRDTRVLIAPTSTAEAAGPLGHEKLAPLLSLFTVAGDAEAMELCQRLLANAGRGHTAIVHSEDPSRQAAFGQAMPASRTLINSSGAVGCIGMGNGLSPSLTLGCGTYGNTSTTDNITYTHLLNVKRLVRPTPTGTPPAEETFRGPTIALPSSDRRARTAADRTPSTGAGDQRDGREVADVDTSRAGVQVSTLG